MSAVETVTDEVLALLQDAQANASARVAGFERHDLHMLWSALEQLRNQSLLTLHDSFLSVSDFTDRERQVLKALADLVVGVAGGAGLDLAGLHPGEVGLNFGVHDDSLSSVVGASEGSGAAESVDSAAPAGGGAP